MTQTVDLVWRHHDINKRRTALFPVAGLPLSGPEAIHRAKIIAGPRWTPGQPGLQELEEQGNKGFNAGPEDIGREGWIKIAEHRFPSGRMNRKSISDIIDRLVEAANVRRAHALPVDVTDF